MKNFFTLNDFFLLCRNETDEWGDRLISSTGLPDFGSDNELLAFSDHSTHSVEALSAPDQKVIDNIMGYALALFIVKTENAGYFGIVMN